MMSSLIIAAYFIKLALQCRAPLNVIKLQRLIYFAHGAHLAKFDVPLISDEIEAWDFGPVIRHIYDTFKHYGNEPITNIPEIYLTVNEKKFPIYMDMFPDDVNETLENVWDIAKDISYVKLSKWCITDDSPWSQAYLQNEKVINQEIIKQYFITITGGKNHGNQ